MRQRTAGVATVQGDEQKIPQRTRESSILHRQVINWKEAVGHTDRRYCIYTSIFQRQVINQKGAAEHTDRRISIPLSMQAYVTGATSRTHEMSGG